MVLKHLFCCGWKELGDAVSYRGSLKSLVQLLVDQDVIEAPRLCTGGFLFTQAGNASKYGFRLEADIIAAGLGKVERLPKFKNYNTGRTIQPFLWIPNKKALIQYVRDNDITKNVIRNIYGYY
jgi:hypothetical protein